MPKKAWGTNEKVEAARDRKNASKATSAAAQKQSQEDEYWKQHDNPKGKKDVKKEEQVRMRGFESLVIAIALPTWPGWRRQLPLVIYTRRTYIVF